MIGNYIKSDLYRYTGSESDKALVKLFLTNRFFRYQVYFRLSQSNNFIIRLIFTLMKRSISAKVNVQISRKVKIGHGLYIPHGNVVINSNTNIGNNCSILQFTSIGSVDENSAIIGDNVYISPNTSIVGGVTIGNNSVIGAGTVVVKNVEDNIIVCGVPAKNIKSSDGFDTYNKYVS
ncbi:serine O-acetyltransferase [Vibrio furnissii]|uniref:serine O-acetyltransferase n=1 Tax=Vibrio furnissii TaxID=29494 RepID=UPI003748EB30